MKQSVTHLIGLICLLVLAGCVAIHDEKKLEGPSNRLSLSHSYPPPGSPPPGPACERKDQPKWLDFFCRFMTKRNWIAHGSPDYQVSSDQPKWRPFYSADSGLLEGLGEINSVGDIADRRYALWSNHFKDQFSCKRSDTVNPYYYRDNQVVPRGDLLGLNWDEISNDSSDPTNGFEEASMFMLFTLSDFKNSYKENESASLSDMLFSIASGDKTFYPDYGGDGDVMLVKPDGVVIPLDDLDIAAKYLDEIGLFYANDIMKTEGESIREAQLLALKKKRSLVHIYLAQDILTLPWADNQTYRKRLDYLITHAALLSRQNNRRDTVVSHGWSVYYVASAAMTYPDTIVHAALAPSPGPWLLPDYFRILRQTKVETRLITGTHDFVAFLGGGVTIKTQESSPCVSPN